MEYISKGSQELVEEKQPDNQQQRATSPDLQIMGSLMEVRWIEIAELMLMLTSKAMAALKIVLVQ
jgi:hypothetical protein